MATEQQFEIDLTNAELPPWFKAHWPKVIRVRAGRHLAEYDMVKKYVSASVLVEMEELILSRPNRGAINRSWPIGFNEAWLPSGYVIRKVGP